MSSFMFDGTSSPRHDSCFCIGTMRLRSNTLLAIVTLTLTVACGGSSSSSAGTRTDGNGSGGSAGAQDATRDSGAGGTGGDCICDFVANGGAGSGGRTGTGGTRLGSGGRLEHADGSSGADGGKRSGSCSFTSVPPAWSDADAGTTSESMVRSQWLHELDSLIGQYLRGDVLVYRGRVKANDNTSAIYAASGASPEPDQSIAEGAALARLEYRPSTGSDYIAPLTAPAGDVAILVVHGVTESKHIVFSQAKANPSITEASTIGADNAFITLRTSCTGCAPSFWSKPDAIDFDLTTTGTLTVFQGIAGQGGHDVDVPLRMTASANLTVAPPCSIGFDDLKVLDTVEGPNEGAADLGLQSFHRLGNEMVFHTSGSINGGATTGRCFLSTPYSIDLFVNLDDLGDYGVRNFAPGTQKEECAP
jgi:hypothetical protein